MIDRSKPRDQVKKIDNPTGLIAKLRHMPGIDRRRAGSDRRRDRHLRHEDDEPDVLGVEPEQQLTVTTIGKDMIGRRASTRFAPTADGVVIGSGVADVLGTSWTTRSPFPAPPAAGPRPASSASSAPA